MAPDDPPVQEQPQASRARVERHSAGIVGAIRAMSLTMSLTRQAQGRNQCVPERSAVSNRFGLSTRIGIARPCDSAGDTAGAI